MRDTTPEPGKPVVTEDELKKLLDEVAPRFKDALAARLAKREPMVYQTVPNKKRRYSLGIGPAHLEAGATVPIRYQTRMVFRGEILINQGDKDGLVMRRFLIDNKPYFEDLWGLPVAEFCEQVSERNKETPMVAGADWFDIEVENTSSVKLSFAAALMGYLVNY